MTRSFVLGAVVALTTMLTMGCDSDETGDDGGGECPNVSGQWTITEHCQSDFVGATLTLVQTGCVLTQIEPFEDWTGSVDSDGSMTWTGEGGESTMTCQATIDGDSMSVTCTPPCDVALTRQ